MGHFEKTPDSGGCSSEAPLLPNFLIQHKLNMSKQLGFAENFALSGAAAIISKTAAAPIERVKLLVQNQDEMLKSGRLKESYKGVIDCTMMKGAGANILRGVAGAGVLSGFDKFKELYIAFRVGKS